MWEGKWVRTSSITGEVGWVGGLLIEVLDTSAYTRLKEQVSHHLQVWSEQMDLSMSLWSEHPRATLMLDMNRASVSTEHFGRSEAAVGLLHYSIAGKSNQTCFDGKENLS